MEVARGLAMATKRLGFYKQNTICSVSDVQQGMPSICTNKGTS